MIVTRLSLNLRGTEEHFVLPDFVVEDQGQYFLARGGEAADGPSIRRRPLDQAQLESMVKVPSGYSIGRGDTVAVIGPLYWQDLMASGIAENPELDDWETFDAGFRIGTAATYQFRQLRESIAVAARRALHDALLRQQARTWPPDCDSLLRLQMADPHGSLEDQLLTRALMSRLTDSVGFDRVARYDAQRLGLSYEEFVDRLDRWTSSLQNQPTMVRHKPWGYRIDNEITNREEPTIRDFVQRVMAITEFLQDDAREVKEAIDTSDEFNRIVQQWDWNRSITSLPTSVEERSE